MIKQLSDKLYTVGSAVSGITGGMWTFEAADDTVLPYGVLSFITNTKSRDTETEYFEDICQISLYGEDYDTLKTISDAMKTAVETVSSYALANYSVMDVTLDFERADKFNDVFRILQQFRFNLHNK